MWQKPGEIVIPDKCASKWRLVLVCPGWHGLIRMVLTEELTFKELTGIRKTTKAWWWGFPWTVLKMRGPLK